MTHIAKNPEVAEQVLTLRRAGIPFEKIADRLNLTPRVTRVYFEHALAAVDPDFQRALEADRMDRLHASLWPKALQGDLDAIDRVVRLSERRERLGTPAQPNQHEMRTAFDASVASATEVSAVDAALVQAGRTIADRVDRAVCEEPGTGKSIYLLPHLLSILREMGATPASRAAAEAAAAAQAGPPQATGNLARLRAVQGARGGA